MKNKEWQSGRVAELQGFRVKDGWQLMLPLASISALILTLFLLFTSSSPAFAQYDPPHEKQGPAVDRLYFKAFNVDRAPLDLEAGEMDMYYYNLKIAAARELQENENVQIYEAPASTLSLILNPAPAPEGRLNPFSLPQVRQAMQYLVDREFVAREIYQGQALPMYTHLKPTSFDYLTIFDIVQQKDLRHDPELAHAMIDEAMIEAGAELVDGVWHYDGLPIRIKFIIRVEDERRELGDLVRAALGKVGFQVEPNYQPFAPAIQGVYSTDPQLFGWHIYTEGWGSGSPQRYDFSSINSFYAPWLGNMPGWQEIGFWQYRNEALDEVGQRLFRGEFSGQDERNEMYREMTQIGLDESVRIWVATIMNSFPAQADVTGITQDIGAGPRSLWTLREAHIPGSDELTVGHLWVWTERTTWNPVGGIGDVYSADIWRNLVDPPIVNHPFTGLPEPFRANFDVETAGPDAKLEVPSDAMMWNADGERWEMVGEGVEATSRVVYDYAKYFQAPWHHGQQISMADVVYSIYNGFDLSYNPEKSKIETVLAVTARPQLESFKGFRILDENQIEVYVDFWHFETDLIASYATPAGPGSPWELLHGLNVVVFDQRRAAFSNIAAARYSVPWISLVLDKDARLVRKALLDLKNKERFPETVFTIPSSNGEQVLMDAAGAMERYQAILDWFGEKGHLIISNGPFTLERYDPPAQFAELHAFRDPNYPFKPGDLYKGTPQFVDYVETDANSIEIGADYEAAITLDGPGTLALRYLLSDAATGEIIQQGKAESVSETEFTISLDADTTFELELGLYKLALAAYSNELAQMTERTIELEADFLVDVETEAEEKVETGVKAEVEEKIEAEEEGGFCTWESVPRALRSIWCSDGE